jgi:hypothetical protein
MDFEVGEESNARQSCAFLQLHRGDASSESRPTEGGGGGAK